MKYSKQRETILNYVKSVKSHPTAEQVYNILKDENSNISLGTVYRNLEKLSIKSDIKRIKLANAKDRFDGNVNHHYHAICLKCGEIIDIFTDYFSDIDKNVEKNNKIKIISHDLIFNTICNKCE